ncbi:vesicle-associated protein 4-2 [Senna tora]|uniref:Vesicle-associated protein 4-2 n=1 Tax=Senna tora TaxID=362788 RepID=A0A834X7G3_9FABA|nr:vesicle-associated protein 4-2 [Senna tora]
MVASLPSSPLSNLEQASLTEQATPEKRSTPQNSHPTRQDFHFPCSILLANFLLAQILNGMVTEFWVIRDYTDLAVEEYHGAKFIEQPENNEKPEKSGLKFKIMSLKVIGAIDYVPELLSCGVRVVFLDPEHPIPGEHSYLWFPFIPLIIILLVGTKLQVIITKMGVSIQETSVGRC